MNNVNRIIRNNIRYVLDQNFEETRTGVSLHKRLCFIGNRDSDESYENNMSVLMLFPDLPITIMHDYKDEYNRKKCMFYLYFHKGDCKFIYKDRMGDDEIIQDFNAAGTIDVLEYLIIYFQVRKFYKTPEQIFNYK